MLDNVEKCTLNIYRLRVIYFETLVTTLDLNIKSRGKNAQAKGGLRVTEEYETRGTMVFRLVCHGDMGRMVGSPRLMVYAITARAMMDLKLYDREL